MTSERAARLVPLLLFGSGACALVYQIAWTRELRLVFGASTAASAAVLAIFIGGLGIGAWLFGPRAERSQRPLVFYATLESLVATFAALTVGLLILVRHAYVALGGSFALGLTGGTIVRLALTAVVLGIPTLLMGGTLPAAARAIESDDDPDRRRLSFLYGMNTLGGVAGAVLATFFLLEAFGTRRTLLCASVVNMLVAIGASLVARHLGAPPAPAPAPTEPLAAAAPRTFVLTVAALAGFAFFLLEISWFRLLGPLLGGTVYTFGLVLALALAGIGIGAVLRGKLDLGDAGLGTLAIVSAAEALAILAPLALGDRLALLALHLRPIGEASFLGAIIGWIIVAGIVVLPAAVASGIQFPILVSLLGRGARGVATDTGLVYLFNTGGAIAGSIAGGFGLLPVLGAVGCWRLAGFSILGTAIVSLALDGGRHRRSLVAVSALALAAFFCGAAPGPGAPWRHSPIGTGRVPVPPGPNETEDWLRMMRRDIVWEAEGVESSVALSRSEGYAFIVNGKVDGHCVNDAGTQVMSGLVGAMLHPAPKRSLVIGLGSGSTAGWLAAVPGMERVDVVELEPAVLRVAEDCAAVNRDVLENERVHISIGDAREALLTSQETWDVIFSEPSNPYRAGIASLFTTEVYEAVEKRLAPGGVFVQWLQAYEVDRETFITVMVTLQAVFPNVSLWRTADGDVVLTATREPVVIDAARLRARAESEPFREALALSWHVEGAEGFLSRHLASANLADQVAARNSSIRNTDDKTVIEFGFARGIAGRQEENVIAALLSLSRTLHAERQPLEGDETIDWTRVDRMRSAQGILGATMPNLSPTNEEMRAVSAAYTQYLVRNFAQARREWESMTGDQTREPRGVAEITVLATSLADAGDEAALPLIEKLRRDHPGSAESLLARLQWRRSQRDEAVATLERTFAIFRENPWIPLVPGAHTLDLALEMSAADGAYASRILTATEKPFALRGLDEARIAVRLAIADAHLDPKSCAALLEPLEPNVPWRQQVLSFRRNCYEASGHSRAAAAKRDLDRWNSQAR